MKRNFGDILHALMKERKISGRSLAKELDVPYKTLQEWLGPGARMPRDPEVLKKVSDYFRVSVHYLLFGVEDQRSLIGEILDKTEIHTGLYEITVKRVGPRNRKD
jgi:transcriptional regulator with XRE-family HTH domain